jgi:hypothetical protein
MKLAIALFALAAALDASAQARTVFAGIPSVKVTESGTQRAVENIPREKAANLSIVISEIGGKYYWATRDNRELARSVSGAFTTYTAVDGVGYVRVAAPGGRFDYVEHLLIGLSSVTYYGSIMP